MITHQAQREKWEKEHKTPHALKQMDSPKASSRVMLFGDFLSDKRLVQAKGVEMGCGKGRNVIWFAQQPFVEKVYGFDFSEVAIKEAIRRAEAEGAKEKTDFRVMDAANAWDYPDNFLDFGIDCTASTDIESPEGRQFAITEMRRVLKPGGFFLVYVMSTEDEYHRMMIDRSPAEEKNAFYHPETGKFEKVFDETELNEMYKDFQMVSARRIEKSAVFFGKEYACRHFWHVYQKM